MKKIVEAAFKYKLITATGLLVKAPESLQKKNVDFLLIGEEGGEYHLLGNKKTFKMWGLLDTKVQVAGIVRPHEGTHTKLSVITFKCVDDFMETDGLSINSSDDYLFDPDRLDYAI